MVETENMVDSSQNLEDEVGRVVEQVKELHDSAASLISRTASDEQSLRQRALSLESSIRRLRSLHDSLLSKKLLDPKLADKACFYLNFLRISLEIFCSAIDGSISLFLFLVWMNQLEDDLQRARCMMVDGEVASFLPGKAQG